MFCPKCGQENPDHSSVCVGCGAALGQAPHRAQPAPGAGPQATGHPQTVPYAAGQRHHIPNHLVWAILATLFCCLPFGIVAIVYAAQVNGHLAGGNVAAAQAASDSAKKWCWWSFASALIVMAGYFLLGVLGVLAGV